jgi:hypothetical protein
VLRWLLDIAGDPNTAEWMQHARAHNSRADHALEKPA